MDVAQVGKPLLEFVRDVLDQSKQLSTTPAMDECRNYRC
jgi:hypothetical protein